MSLIRFEICSYIIKIGQHHSLSISLCSEYTYWKQAWLAAQETMVTEVVKQAGYTMMETRAETNR